MPCCTAFNKSFFPTGRRGRFYSQTIRGICEDGAVCSIGFSGTLPPGLSFNSTGSVATFTGTPTQRGCFSFTLTLSCVDCPDDIVQNFSICIQLGQRVGGVVPELANFCQSIATVREQECTPGRSYDRDSCRFWNNYYNSRCGSSSGLRPTYTGPNPTNPAFPYEPGNQKNVNISGEPQKYIACVRYDASGNIIHTRVGTNCRDCGTGEGCIG